MNNKKILFSLITVFVIFLAYRIMHPFRQETVPLKYTGKNINMKKGSSTFSHDASDQIQDLYLFSNLLYAPPEHSYKVYKNPFYKQNITPPSQKSPLKSSIDNLNIVKEKLPSEKVREDFSRFRIFGFYNKNDNISLFLKRGNQIFIISRGDVINGKYKVENISRESVTLKAEHIDDLVHIDLKNL